MISLEWLKLELSSFAHIIGIGEARHFKFRVLTDTEDH